MGKKNNHKLNFYKNKIKNQTKRNSTYYSSILFSKNHIRSENPDIFHFSKYSKFIYEPSHSNYYFNKIRNKNRIKPSELDKKFLLNIINEINISDDNDKLFVLPFFKLLMEQVSKNQPTLDKRDLFIKSIINTFPNNENISIKKIAEKYNSLAEAHGLNKIGTSSIHTIMRKKLLLRFKKKSIKSKKLIEKNFIKFIFFYLKIFCRCLRLGMKFIFVDESGFFLHNTNYRTWLEKNEEIYFYNKGNKKVNLLLAVTGEKVIYYKMQEENTTSENFKAFIEEMIEKINTEDIHNYVIILDNCTCHLTKELFNIYKNYKLKVLFNVPYLSNFNMVEKVFRLIKNKTYKLLYNNINELKNDVKKILGEEKTKESLKKLLKETIEEYINYIDKNENVNLNSL